MHSKLNMIFDTHQQLGVTYFSLAIPQPNDHVAKTTRKDYHLQPKMSFTIVLLVANDIFSSNEHETNVITYAFNIHNMKYT